MTEPVLTEAQRRLLKRAMATGIRPFHEADVFDALTAKAKGLTDSDPPQRYDAQRRQMTRCQCGDDGDCTWASCPQLRDGEPKRSGRHCPLDQGQIAP